MDRVLRTRILSRTAGRRLWVSHYTASQFGDEYQARLSLAEDPLSMAGEGEYCFDEERDPAAYKEKIEKLMIYRWNRAYPSDVRFTMDMSGLELSESVDFAGYSHEKITEDIYVKTS